MSEPDLPCPRCTSRDWHSVLGEPNQWRCLGCLWISQIGEAGVMELLPDASEKPPESPDDLRAALSEWHPTLEWSEANRLICQLVHRDARRDLSDAC